MVNQWSSRDYILDSLSTTHPITERVIKTSVPESHQKQVDPALASMVEAGLVIQHGKKYLKHERTRNED